MTDHRTSNELIASLRDGDSKFRIAAPRSYDGTLARAADEIERLTRDRDLWKERHDRERAAHAKNLTEQQKVEAERDRLTRELSQARAGFDSLNGAHEALRQRFARACAEVTRLSGDPSASETTARTATCPSCGATGGHLEGCSVLITAMQWLSEKEARTGWQPIETAPKDGRTLLLGYFNKLGNWRSLHGQWFEQSEMDEWTSDDYSNPAGWYGISVENDDPPNCWATEPTHWRPTPQPPEKAKEGQS